MSQIATGILHQINSGDRRVQWIQWHCTNTHVLFWSDRRTNVNPGIGTGPCSMFWANGVSLHLSSCSRVWIWVLQINSKKQYPSPLLTNTVGVWWAFFLFIVWIAKIQMFTLELRCCLIFIQLQLFYSIELCFLMQYMQIYFQCFVCWLNRVVGNDILIMMPLFRLVVHSHSPWN